MAFNRSKVNVAGNAVPEVPPLTKEDAFKLLAQNAARNACYNSEQRYPPPNCHLGTRTEVLVKLSKWIEGHSHNTRIYWVYGPAGVGKSAIAQALAEKYASNRLAGCFFFSRNDTSRDKLDPFVATVAYQLLKSDTLRERQGSFIIQAIRSDPNIFHTSVENPFQKLILEPCSKLIREMQHSLQSGSWLDFAG
ncbi:hypothetical protein MPER_00966, partial [Moniliophthora perniciosa FA553]